MTKKTAKRVKARAPKKAAAARTITKPAPTKGKSKSASKSTKARRKPLEAPKRNARAAVALPAEELAVVPAATDEGIRSLPPRQRDFVAHYLANGSNATQAAKDAGYSAKTAESQGSRLLRNVKVKAAIDAAVAPTLKRLEVTKEYVLEAIVQTVERCRQAEPVTYRGFPIPGQFQFDSMGVMKGAELLGKHLKMFTDKVEHSGKVTLETLVLGADEVGG